LPFLVFNTDDVKRIVIVALFFVFPVFSLFSQEQKIKRSDIIENLRGMPYYIHFVNAGETLTALAEAYAVTADEIIRANPEISAGLKANQVLKIPVQPGAASVSSNPEAEQTKVTPDHQATAVSGTTHTIEPKETWYGISRIYQVPVKDLISANPGIDTLRAGMSISIPVKKTAKQPETGPGQLQHVVQPQETIYSLTKKYNVTIDELYAANPGLSDGLKAGQTLNIPSKQGIKADPEPAEKPRALAEPVFKEHTVEKKETLYGISKQYGVEISDILKANPGLGSELKKNDVLRIPIPGPVKTETIAAAKEPVEQKNETAPAPAKRNEGPCDPERSRNQAYTVALMIPFMLEEADSINTGDPVSLRLPSEYHSLDFIQFYEGALIAIDSLTKAGMNVKVHVYDADAGEQVSKTRKILAKAEMAEVDLIIGPFFAKSFELVAAFAASHSIPVINPLSQRSEILEDYPGVFKIQPSAWSQYNETARYIVDGFSGSNVLVIRRNKDENSGMAEALKTSVEKHSSGMMKVKEAIYSQSFDAGLFNNLVAGKKNVIVVLTSDKALLPALLRKLNDARGKYDITVFGLPEWESMELDSQYLLNLKTHLYNGWFVDYSNREVQSFVGTFTERYKTEPVLENYAFLGYDITFYFLNNLFTYGRNFSKCLSSVSHKGLSTGFIFRKAESGGYENAGSSVYELKEYKRRLVNR
jgi:LysM repeat protein/ABC-type branched-subunit amino acid transport system substrate-binding protein